MNTAVVKQSSKATGQSSKATGPAKPDFNPHRAAQDELVRRELARRRLLPFVQRFCPKYIPGWVHMDICQRLEKFSEAVTNEESPRLMLFMPPRHGKSQISSKSYPAWHLGHNPDHEFMLCSYSGALSMSFSRTVRAIMRDPAYHNLFPTNLDPDSQSVEAWMTTAGGGLVAAGVGGAITGKGAHVLLIDDPVKNREDADSELSRRNCWDWYTSTAYTRLAPGGGVLVIQTRWHDDDLSGRLLDAQSHAGDIWEVVEYPAIADKDEEFRKRGEPLHAERYSIAQLQNIRNVVGPRDWSALYQQKPVADEGSYFHVDMFRRYEPRDCPLRENLTTYMAWDFAVGKGEENDWTAGVVVGIDKDFNLWVLDSIRGKWDGYGIVKAMLDAHVKWGTEKCGMEKGQILMSIDVFLQKEIEKRELFDFVYEPISPGKNDKMARARGIQGLMETQRVLFPAANSTTWVDALVWELQRFPNGINDDQVDAIAYIGYLYGEMMPPPEEKEKPKPSWRDKLAKYITDDAHSKRWQRS